MRIEIQKLNTCCFFGHRKIISDDKLVNDITSAIENLIINHHVDTFLFGSKSQFDRLCYKIVSRFKTKYPNLKRIYVRAEFPYIDDQYRSYLLERYEDTYFPDQLYHAGKAVYIERNYEMIQNSKYAIIYYKKNYIPPHQHYKKDLLLRPSKGGTKIAYEYSKQKGLLICNVYCP